LFELFSRGANFVKTLISARRAIGAAVACALVGFVGAGTSPASAREQAPATVAAPAALSAPAALASSPGATYTPINPARLADTRRGFGSSLPGRLPAGGTAVIRISGRSEAPIPLDATAAVVNITVDNAAAAGYATVYPTGIGRPDASNLNYSGAGYTGANLVTVKLGSGGAINVFSDKETHLLVDVLGYYAPAPGPVAAGRVESVTLDRVYDTRGANAALAAGEYRTVTLPRIPAGATGVILNYTVTGTFGGGFFSILPPAQKPASGEPNTSNVNVTQAGATVANQAIVPIGADRQVTLYSSGGGHVILDLAAYVTGASSPASTNGLFVPLAPFRMLDTRATSREMNPLGPTLRMWPNWVVDVALKNRGGLPDSGFSAVVGNTTFVDSNGGGYLSAYPAGTVWPGTSTVNTFAAGQTVPNHTLTPISQRGVSIRAGDTGGHVLLDVSGYYLGTAGAAPIGPSTNVPPEPQFPLTLSIPSIGHQSNVQSNASDAALVRGPGWWEGSAYPGVGGNFVIFGHRTEYGGPLRYINGVGSGDQIVVEGDHRRVVYEVVGDWIVVGANEANQYVGPSTLPGEPNIITLIACTLPNGAPTSLAYRIIIRAKLVSYTNY
jgi:sortase (surface protein transpeptidase)